MTRFALLAKCPKGELFARPFPWLPGENFVVTTHCLHSKDDWLEEPGSAFDTLIGTFVGNVNRSPHIIELLANHTILLLAITGTKPDF